MITDVERHAAHILVVDDEEVNLGIMRESLEFAGYTHLTLTVSPHEAVRLYESSTFDLILLDINMPIMNGFDVLQRFHEITVEDMPPVLIMTAQGDRDTRVRALTQGARDFLSKPFDEEEVLNRIRNLLEMHLAMRQLQQYSGSLQQAVRQRTQELEQSQQEIVQRLGFAGEYRDTDTGEHTLRVGLYARCLGLAVGMSEEDAETLCRAAPMHDIGKIGIPDRILLKPGKLDQDEWTVMKAHASIGAKILAGNSCELLQIAQVVALSHHEKWDGQGYPGGLSGADIPHVGRIVAVTDVFDALTMERPYKKAWPIAQAVALIQSESGKHFDPALVRAFESVLPDILRIRDQHAH